MKKLLLSLFISLSFFLITENVNALEFNLKPQEFNAWEFSSHLGRATQFSSLLYWGNDYYINQVSGNLKVMRVAWFYNNISSYGIKINHSYDVSFMIFQPNIQVASLNGFNGGKPIVLMDNNTCEVQYASSSTSSSATWYQGFAVRCENIMITRDNFDVDIYTPDTDTSHGLVINGNYGISVGYSFNDHFDVESNSDLKEALDKNSEEIKKQTEATKEQTETIKDNNTDEASNSANSFFKDFESDDFGLTSVITSPMNFINNISSSSCSPLKLHTPFVNKDIELPCMSTIYSSWFGDLLNVYQIFTMGIIAYYVCVNILRMTKNFKNPNNDEIEVIDL